MTRLRRCRCSKSSVGATASVANPRANSRNDHAHRLGEWLCPHMDCDHATGQRVIAHILPTYLCHHALKRGRIWKGANRGREIAVGVKRAPNYTPQQGDELIEIEVKCAGEQLVARMTNLQTDDAPAGFHHAAH